MILSLPIHGIVDSESTYTYGPVDSESTYTYGIVDSVSTYRHGVPWDMSYGTCPMGHVPWDMSHVTCPMGRVPWDMSARRAGRNAGGGPDGRDQTPAGIHQTHQNHTKHTHTHTHTHTHHNTPEPHQDAPEPHQNTPSITKHTERTHRSTQNSERSHRVRHKDQGHAHAHALGALFAVANPSHRSIIVSRAHTASHRTHERNKTISRLVSPPNLRSQPSDLSQVISIRISVTILAQADLGEPD